MLGQGAAAAIAIVLGVLAVLVSVDIGLIGVYAVADWLIAVALLKCWQLNTSRDCAHVLIIAALLLLVGALVSGHLNYAISLVVMLLAGPGAFAGWHLLAESERYAALRGTSPTAVADSPPPGGGASPWQPPSSAQPSPS